MLFHMSSPIDFLASPYFSHCLSVLMFATALVIALRLRRKDRFEDRADQRVRDDAFEQMHPGFSFLRDVSGDPVRTSITATANPLVMKIRLPEPRVRHDFN